LPSPARRSSVAPPRRLPRLPKTDAKTGHFALRYVRRSEFIEAATWFWRLRAQQLRDPPRLPIDLHGHEDLPWRLIMFTTPTNAVVLAETKDQTRYLIQVVRWQLARIRKQWLRYQCSRHRNAVYLYLGAVFDLVTSWHGDAYGCASQALGFHGCPIPRRIEPFDVAIRCTSDPAQVDARTRSKWSRALRFADRSKKPSEPWVNSSGPGVGLMRARRPGRKDRGSAD
jgi:hypothetical protein